MIESFEIRVKEKAEMLSYVKNSINTFIFGPDGIGKTTLTKTVAEEVNSKFGQAVYVDCSLYQTANAVLREMLLSLGSVIASKSNYELIKRLKEKTRKPKPFVFLDHFENLKNYEVLNILLGLGLYVCLVSDSFESYRKMNLPLRSRITNIIKMEQLSKNEILEIVREGADPDTSDELLQKIVEKSDGNLTFALNLLKSATNSGKDVKSIECINLKKNAFGDISNEDCRIILQILQQTKRLPSGEVYRLYCEKSEYPKSERSFRKYMGTLRKQGLIISIGEKKGRVYEIVEEV